MSLLQTKLEITKVIFHLYHCYNNNVEELIYFSLFRSIQEHIFNVLTLIYFERENFEIQTRSYSNRKVYYLVHFSSTFIHKLEKAYFELSKIKYKTIINRQNSLTKVPHLFFLSSFQ